MRLCGLKKRKRSELSEFKCPFDEQCDTLYYPMLMARLCITDNRAVQTYAGPRDKKNCRAPLLSQGGARYIKSMYIVYRKKVMIHYNSQTTNKLVSDCRGASEAKVAPDLTGDSWPTKGPSRPKGHPLPRVVWHPDTFYSRQVCGEWTDTVHTICPPCA